MTDVARHDPDRIDWSDRFWSKVHPEALSGCWLWHGAICPGTGYGTFNKGVAAGGGYSTAHRWSWTLVHGAPGAGLCVCHRCDVRACVNPVHLFLGTKKDNSRDMVSKGRQGMQPPSERCYQAKLTVAQVAEIRARLEAGEVGRRLASEFGVYDSTISRIRTRQRWFR